MNEKYLEVRMRDEIKRMGGIAVKLNSFSLTGLPDRMVLMPGGRIFFAELKTTGKKPRPRQLICISMLHKLGFSVSVIDDETSLHEFFSMIDQ